jgi:CRISPR-associated protein Csb1
MSSTLFATVRDHLADPAVAAVVAETTWEPLNGPGAPVVPPTYARPSNDPSKAPNFAYSPEAFIPVPTGSGWHFNLARLADGTPRITPQIVINGVSAETGMSETSLWRNQDRLGIPLPGLILKGETSPDSDSFEARQLADALSVIVSSWETAHRQADAWFRAATRDHEHQIWDEEAPKESRDIKDLIASANARNGDDLYRYFPNAAIYGFWTSSGTVSRHKLPRAYSSQIVGYGAHPVKSASTKLDPMGATPKDPILSRKNGVVKITDKGGKKPSEFGFGQIPTEVTTRGFVCELILQQSSISLEVLRTLEFSTEERALAGRTVLCLLAMAGRRLATENGFLRSSCALVAGEERWGWRRHHGQSRDPEPLEIRSTDELLEALREAVSAAEQVGLAFADPIELSFSDEEKKLVEKRVKDAIAGKDEKSE